MKKLKFEWYVLNENFNKREIEPFNIFRNSTLLNYTNELCVKYKRNKMTFDEFVEELRQLIMWQEWSRAEYEIMVGGLFAKDESDYVKIDCYAQALPNIRLIAKYVLEEYYPRLKIDLGVKEYD